MESSTAWSADSRAALAAVAASAAVLAGLTGAAADHSDPPGAVPLRDGDPPGTDPLRDLADADPPDADPLRDLADSCLDGLAEVARLEARTAALKVRLAADYVQATRALAPPAASPQEHICQEMALTAEVACVLTVSERTSRTLLAGCQALVTGLPLTLGALQAGTISWAHARIIIEETSTLDAAGAAALEAHFLDPGAPDPARGCPAGDLVAGRFRAKARTWRERHHPASIEERHTTSAEDRRVDYTPDRDGMAWLSAYLPADTAAGIWERTTAAARALQNPHEARTLTQLRADITAIWLLTSGTAEDGMAGGGRCMAGGVTGAAGRVPSPRAQVLITVPVLSLLGATDEPAVLDGYGPIPASMARRLIADGAGSFHRVLTDPRDGAPLEIGRTNYRLTKAQRQWLRLRDGKCPFPGCNNHSLDNEADHLLAWADGGTTGISNLGQTCPRHHRLKHGSAWTPTGASKDHPPGWTSPSGRHYPSEHQDWEPPHWPHHLLTAETCPDHVPPPDPGHHPDQAPTRHPSQEPRPGPGMGPGPELPPDPFPDWHQFTTAHPLTAAHTDDPGRPTPLDDPYPECLLLHCV
ncbi:HNH endonuclease signature motif containing protein [Arthrobacter sp. RHLT1-20]